jgi:hypothetical protein
VANERFGNGMNKGNDPITLHIDSMRLNAFTITSSKDIVHAKYNHNDCGKIIIRKYFAAKEQKRTERKNAYKVKIPSLEIQQSGLFLPANNNSNKSSDLRASLVLR